MSVPLVWPRTGASPEGLAAALWNVINTDHSVPGPHDYPVGSYVRWATDSANALQPWLRNEDIDRLMRTPVFWSALNMSPSDPTGSRVVQHEIRDRLAALRRTVESVEQFSSRFSNIESSMIVMPDTNVLLHHRVELTGIEWHRELREHVRTFDVVRLVIPLLVVDELDNAKRRRELKTRARTTLKHIYRTSSSDASRRSLISESTADHGAVWLEVLTELPDHARLTRPDDELVSVAGRLGDAVGQPVLFVTYDTGAGLRATAAKVKHVLLSDEE